MGHAWDGTHKINPIGRSFGGNTLLMLLDLLQNGSEAERQATKDASLSPLFSGGKGD